MSSDLISAPKPIKDLTYVEGQCGNPSCKAPLKLPFPPIQVFNDPTVSVVAVPHTQGLNCSVCNTYHNIIIYPPATSVCLAIVPMDKPLLNEDSKIISFTGHLKGLKGN